MKEMKRAWNSTQKLCLGRLEVPMCVRRERMAKTGDWRLFKPVFEGFPRQISRFQPKILKVRKILHKSYIFYVQQFSERRKRSSWSRSSKGYLWRIGGSCKFEVFFKAKGNWNWGLRPSTHPADTDLGEVYLPSNSIYHPKPLRFFGACGASNKSFDRDQDPEFRRDVHE